MGSIPLLSSLTGFQVFILLVFCSPGQICCRHSGTGMGEVAE